MPSFEDFDRRARNGERLTVVFIGGSLTWGARASDPLLTSYRALIGRRLEETYPHAHFRFYDAAIGGSGSQLGAFRLQRDVLDRKPDLVFLDFSLNDGIYETTPDTLAAHEAIVRRVITEGGCPLVQMLLAARSFVEDEHGTANMRRRDAHLALAQAYHLAVGDAIALMQDKYRKGEIDLDVIWPPAFFDTTHPDDPGYALYAEAAWQAFQQAVAEQRDCTAPETMLHADTYMHWARVRLSSLPALPAGWHVALPQRGAVAFDFTMSRWLDDVTVGSNFIETGREDTVPAPPAQPLCVKFEGSSVLLFGESTPRSMKFLAVIDGEARECDAGHMGKACNGNAHLWLVIAEGLDPQRPHTLEIRPLFDGPAPQELRIESLCIAGGNARVWME